VERGRVLVASEGQATGLAVLGSQAHVTLPDSGTAVVDISNPDAPELAARFDLRGAQEPAAIGGAAGPSLAQTVALVNIGSEALPGGAWMLDASDRRAVDEMGSLVSIDWPEVQGARQLSWDRLRMVAATQDDLRVFDVSNPRGPRVLTDLTDRFNDIWEVVLAGGRIYLTDGVRGLVVLELVPAR
jgi:hypothetical protein